MVAVQGIQVWGGHHRKDLSSMPLSLMYRAMKEYLSTERGADEVIQAQKGVEIEQEVLKV